MHSRLLSDLLAPGSTPALQLPALDMTRVSGDRLEADLSRGPKVQIHPRVPVLPWGPYSVH